VYSVNLSLFYCSQEELKKPAIQRLELTAPAILGINSTQAKQSEAELTTDESNPLEQLDITKYLVIKKPDEEGPDVRGGHPDALIIHATKANKNGESQFVIGTDFMGISLLHTEF
jgi:Rap guanine nucleotide exchange factor 1